MSRRSRRTAPVATDPRTSGWRRVGNATVNGLIIAMMICAVAWVVPQFFGYSRYVITGGSMTGSYDKGSVVFEKPVPASELKVGDVITYLPPADAGVPTLVTHRILAVEPAEGGGVVFTTQGDANPDPDPWHFQLVDSSQPVVQFGVPHVGWLFIGLADRTFRMLLIGLPALMVALASVAQVLTALRRGNSPDSPAPAPATAEKELVGL